MKLLGYVIAFVVSSAILASVLAINTFWLFLLWPYAVKAVFPAAVASGAIPGILTFWQAAAVTVVSNLLFKSSTSSSAPIKNA